MLFCRAALACLCLIVSSAGCWYRFEVVLPPPEPIREAPPGVFRAGASKVDITPMPGYPMGGFAAAGRISRGVWTRLYARAFAFEAEDGNAMAMVTCDLWSMPAGLADEAARLAHEKYGARRLGREQIVFAATHTHHSPGNYASAVIYNLLGSPADGFDKDLFDYLADRIACAVANAWHLRRKATIRWNQTMLGEIARNRSIVPFLFNGDGDGDGVADGDAILFGNQGLPTRHTPFPVGQDEAYLALDPALTVIRIDAADGNPDDEPVGVMAFYAVHPTSMGPPTEVYSSDLFGVATTLLEQEHGTTVVGIFNGAEGDVSSNWRQQNRPSALALGEKLADGIRTALSDEAHLADVTGGIAFAFERYDIQKREKTPALPAKKIEPRGSAAMLAGSEGDWAFLRDAGYHEGMARVGPKPLDDEHWSKMDMLPEDLIETWVDIDLSKMLRILTKVPARLPIGVYKLGKVLIGTLPGEFTTVMGRRIAREIGKGRWASGKILLVGLANEYLSYFSTPEEFDLQHYEGGSMLYGRHAGNRIKTALGRLAASVGSRPLRSLPETHVYTAGERTSFGIEEFGVLDHKERLEDTYNYLANVLYRDDQGIPEPDNPYFVWVDEKTDWDEAVVPPRRVTPLVSIQEQSNGSWKTFVHEGVAETDAGLHFTTTLVASFDHARWITIWMAPEGVDPDTVLRFEVVGTSGKIAHSPPFTLAGAIEDWGYTGFARLTD